MDELQAAFDALFKKKPEITPSWSATRDGESILFQTPAVTYRISPGTALKLAILLASKADR